MDNEEIIEVNKNYWNEHADLWFGTTALSKYGVRFPTEDDLHLFQNINDKKMLEICSGSGHSLFSRWNIKFQHNAPPFRDLERKIGR